MNEAVVADRPLEELAEEISARFAEIPTRTESRPRVGLVGEIYLRHNRFSNNHLIEKLEKLGLEVWLASFAEWPLYTSTTFRLDSWTRRDVKGYLKAATQLYVQGKQEHSLVEAFAKHMPIQHDRPVGEVLKQASQYLPLEAKGEAILSIGKAIEMSESGVSGIVNAMPFNCMPGTIVSSLSKKISDDLGSVPWLNISYEGLRDSGEDTRLEAFADQVISFSRRTSANAPTVPTADH
jgi:predicted nucleotide-binding protein (sugar kinase/HSP70/actin superfamily)